MTEPTQLPPDHPCVRLAEALREERIRREAELLHRYGRLVAERLNNSSLIEPEPATRESLASIVSGIGKKARFDGGLVEPEEREHQGLAQPDTVLPLQRSRDAIALGSCSTYPTLLGDALDLAHSEFPTSRYLLGRIFLAGVGNADVMVTRFEPRTPMRWINRRNVS